jgi:hypothetical protein
LKINAPALKIGQPIELHLSPRYFQFNRAHAIRDVFDALVELITNSDDSYHRLFRGRKRTEDGGPILIEYLAGKQAALRIYDRAEGMTLSQMYERLGDVGTRQSEEGDRGFMARGAKDCTELGALTFESIKDDKFYKCTLTQKPQFIPNVSGERVTPTIREQLHIQRGNGTAVTLQLGTGHSLPRFDKVARELGWHVALRDILADDSPTRLLLRNLNRPQEDTERVVFRPPLGDVIYDEPFQVPGYKEQAHLKIWRATEVLEDPGERFRRSGFLIKGERAIHECTLFSQEFERDPLAKKYFGRVECGAIDRMLREYDGRRENGQLQTQENPTLLIDPNRQNGLNRDHPFTQSLFLIPSERLRALIAAERENERVQKREIANRETQTRLDRLAKKAAEFLKQQLEDIQELSTGDDIDKSAFKQAAFIFPTYFTLAVGEERVLTYYLNAALVSKNHQQPIASVAVDDPSIIVKVADFQLRPHNSKPDRMVGTFTVKAQAVSDSTIIRVKYGDLADAQAIASVVESRIDEHAFDQPLEFEHLHYKVREGSRRSLILFAKYPDVVSESTVVSVTCSDAIGVAIRGSCTLIPIAGSNYAEGTIVVQGRKIHARADITASVNGRDAKATIRVVQQPPDAGAPIDIKLRDEDYGNFRARWADHEGKPNLLLVSARHKSLARYLGPPPDFQGQNAPLFRVLLAEIVAESVCRKSLTLESKERTWEFRWADLKEDHLIADDVFAKLQQRIRDFVAEAHGIMLSDTEVEKIVAN